MSDHRIPLLLWTAVKREAEAQTKLLAAEVKSELIERGSVGDTVKIGNQRAHITLVCPEPKPEFTGGEPGFFEFMQEHGMTVEKVSDKWVEHVVEVNGQVIWQETGEVVPGARVRMVEKASYTKVERMSSRDVLFEAKKAGMLDAVTLPMLEGETYGD